VSEFWAVWTVLAVALFLFGLLSWERQYRAAVNVLASAVVAVVMAFPFAGLLVLLGALGT
jgi:ABC-type methionine transport system permease subunit